MKICGLKLADIGLKLKNTFKYVVCGFGLVFFTFTIYYGLEVALLAGMGKKPGLSMCITNFRLFFLESGILLCAYWAFMTGRCL